MFHKKTQICASKKSKVRGWDEVYHDQYESVAKTGHFLFLKRFSVSFTLTDNVRSSSKLLRHVLLTLIPATVPYQHKFLPCAT